MISVIIYNKSWYKIKLLYRVLNRIYNIAGTLLSSSWYIKQKIYIL